MSRLQFVLVLVILVSGAMGGGARRNNRSAALNGIRARDPKILSLFQIVSFPNLPCAGSSPAKSGTCYTAEECADKGGANAGSCASGYGVCCTFTVNCGGTSSENSTYFESTGSESSRGCVVKICRASGDICQLRLDFEHFVISGPSTESASSEVTLNGHSLAGPKAAGVESSLASRCLTDKFTVTNPSGAPPPTICGSNTGQHMYVGASEGCNSVVFQLGSVGVGTEVVERQWIIKVTQYECTYNNLAPEGCTQYVFDATTDVVQTYNFDGGQHLADQNQNICVRRERGKCRICWSAQEDADFMVSGNPAEGAQESKGYVKASVCCGYGVDGKGIIGNKKVGYDCVVIPGAEDNAGAVKPEEICGRGKGLVTMTANQVSATICSTRQPFSIRFASNSFETTDEGSGQAGFRLAYFQDSENCHGAEE